MRIDAFFDIETETWDRFVAGGLSVDGQSVSVYWDEDQFARAILSLEEGEIWAWNGGLYDAIWLADWLQRHGIKFSCVFAGTRIVSLTVGKLRIKDAAALVPMSLQRASTMLGEPISKSTGLVCSCGRDCGGYCRIRRDMSASERIILMRYLREDVATGWAILVRIMEHAERAGYELTGTIGGSVWRTMRESLDIGPAIWLTGSDYERARAGYFGGRVFVGATVARAGHRSDIHSAYPAALSTVSLPYGEYITCRDTARVREVFDRARPGVYECTVNVPWRLIPPLPWRSPAGRIVYPIGRVRGSWALPELAYAIEQCGVDIEAFHSCIIWAEEAILFDGFMSQVFDVRAMFDKDTNALNLWQKLFGNSGTGKFAESPQKERLFVNLAVSEIRACNPADERCWNLGCRWGSCSGRCGAMTPLNFDGNLWLQSYWRLSDCAHVQWAAYLTAQTRINWHSTAVATGEEEVLYGDTDSLYTTRKLPDYLYGEHLGSWGYEGDLVSWRCIAPKSYRYLTSTGKAYARGKGIPDIDLERWDAFASGQPVSLERGVRGLRSAGRNANEGGSLFTRKKIERRHHGKIAPGEYIGDRRIGLDGIRTEPITVRDQLERERSKPRRHHQ